MIRCSSQRLAVALTCLLLAAEAGPAADAPAAHYRPQLTNSKGKDFQDFPMGVLSATGRLGNGDTAIEVKHVGAGGVAAAGGLAVGDRIVAIQGRRSEPFRMNPDTGLAGPQQLLGVALDDACADDDRTLKLRVLRDGEQLDLSFELPESPRFGRAMPKGCEKSRAYLLSICRHLRDTQQKNGGWKPGVGGDAIDYTAAFCGLTLIAAGDPEFLPTIRKTVKFVQGKELAKIDPNDPKVGPKNWIAAAVAIFLAEYHLATGDDSVLEDLQKCCDLLAQRVSDKGTMGHKYEITYNGGGLTIINVQAHLAWVLAARCGCKIDTAAWNRSIGEVGKALTKKGGVGYSSRARGDSDAPARTGCMAVALALSGQAPDAARNMGKWLENFNNRLRMAHTNASIGLIFGTAGIKATNPRMHGRHMRNWMPYLELCRSAGEGAQFFGSKANYGGDEYLGLDAIGNATVGLMLASGDDHLFLFGGKKKGWLTDAK